MESLYWQTRHRYGVRLPKATAEALRIDQKNGDTLWWDAICKEMANVRVTYEEFSESLSKMKPCFKKLTCHLIFEVNLSENFRRKARFIADGHKTSAPK